MININHDMLKDMTPEERARLAKSLDRNTEAAMRRTSATKTTTAIFSVMAVVAAIGIVATIRG